MEVRTMEEHTMGELRPQELSERLRVMLPERPPATQSPHRPTPSILQPYPALPRLSQREGSATTGAVPPGTVRPTQGPGRHTSSLNPRQGTE